MHESRRIFFVHAATSWLVAPAHDALNVLFCGAVTVRKGVPYLLEAARRLASHQFRFRLVGPVSLPDAIRRDFSRRCDLAGPVPRPSMPGHYRWADVLVLPSICEGSATVCYEALAAGLPVITTPNAGSVVRDGIEGYIVPIRDGAAMAQKLDLLASAPRLRAELAANAAARSLHYTVSHYAARLLSLSPCSAMCPNPLPGCHAPVGQPFLAAAASPAASHP